MGLSLARPPASDVPPPARSGWEQHLVAQKPAAGPWPKDAAARIAAARRCYDAGTHELVSLTTPNRWTQLYCVPRKVAAGQRTFFTELGNAA